MITFVIIKIEMIYNIYRKTDTNDWYEVIDSATGKCLKSNPMRKTVGIKPLLHIGCKKVSFDLSAH